MFVFLSSEYPPPALLRLFCIRYLRSSGSLHLCAARSIVFCVPVDFKIGGLLELSSSAKKISYSKVFMSDFDTRFFESCRSFPAHCSAHILSSYVSSMPPVLSMASYSFVESFWFLGLFLSLSLCRSIGCHGRTAHRLLLRLPESSGCQGQNRLPVHEVDVP